MINYLLGSGNQSNRLASNKEYFISGRTLILLSFMFDE